MKKNRLVRCYLGASRKWSPDPFIGFDQDDDTRLKNFADTAQYCGPYPILNGALNLSGGTPLAWQERKSASFVFTPLYTGYDKCFVDQEANGGSVEIKTRWKRVYVNGYQPTEETGYPSGLALGTAMGISGAAANPNMGYHTSTAVAFLLTVFNVRLGWWLGNPARDDKYQLPGPRLGLPYLAVELFGLANTDKSFVNVSDGGHFENLGIYELVRRHCRYIIAGDAEQDGELTFGGLANAIRKCRTDLGVEIDVDVEQLRRKNAFSGAHCVVGTITYPGDDLPGYLLYLKSSLTGNEDVDVLEYRSRQSTFPHQSTGDQWFDESQFESYRKLGLHIANVAFGAQKLLIPADEPDYKRAKLELFHNLRDMLYPPSEAIQRSFTNHADTYTKLIDEIGAATDLAYLDPFVLNAWKELKAPPDIGTKRQARYLCASFLQLMENVFLDLKLEDAKQRNHPHNAGWLELFRGWVVTSLSGMPGVLQVKLTDGGFRHSMASCFERRSPVAFGNRRPKRWRIWTLQRSSFTLVN